MVFTKFFDMCSGGFQKTPFALVVIEGDEETAIGRFKDRFDSDPTATACECCGPNFAIDEYDTVEEAIRHYKGYDTAIFYCGE